MTRKHGKALEKLAAKMAEELHAHGTPYRKALATARGWLEEMKAILKGGR